MGSDCRLSSGSDDVGNTWLQQDIYRSRDDKTSKKTYPIPAQKAKPAESTSAEKAKQASSWLPVGLKASQEVKGNATAESHTPRHKDNSKMQFLKHYFRAANP
jgi:hypothetical protein